MTHPLADCAQNSRIDGFEKALDRIDHHVERTADALEKIAAQGVMVQNHENRLNKHEGYIEESFKRIREIERVHSEEAGAAKVEEKGEKFWTEVKLKMITPAITMLFFILYVMDQFDIFTKIAILWRQFKVAE